MEAQDVSRFGRADSRTPLLATGSCRALSHRSVAHRCPERVDAGRCSHRTTSDACGIAFQTQPPPGLNAPWRPGCDPESREALIRRNERAPRTLDDTGGSADTSSSGYPVVARPSRDAVRGNPPGLRPAGCSYATVRASKAGKDVQELIEYRYTVGQLLSLDTSITYTTRRAPVLDGRGRTIERPKHLAYH